MSKTLQTKQLNTSCIPAIRIQQLMEDHGLSDPLENCILIGKSAITAALNLEDSQALIGRETTEMFALFDRLFEFNLALYGEVRQKQIN